MMFYKGLHNSTSSRRVRTGFAFAAFLGVALAGSSFLPVTSEAAWADPPDQQGTTTTAPMLTIAGPPAAEDGQAHKALPKIYDEKADVKQLIADALVKAKKEDQRVLIQWGGNWCVWCRALHGLYQKDRGIANELMHEYVVVYADIGQWNKNIDLAKSYGADLKAHGVPYLTVLDTDGKVVVDQDSEPLELKGSDQPAHDPAKVMEFLKKYQVPTVSADSVLGDALTKAKSEDKLVFLDFSAVWCPWCHKLQDWMAQPEVAKILGKEFVDVKIDTERMTGGGDMLKEYAKSDMTGIPWFVFINPKTGKAVADSTGEKGNIGFPVEDFEIAHFAKMLGAANQHLTKDDIDTLVAALKESSVKIKAAQSEAAGGVGHPH